jgi:hypothetical protein
MVSLVPADLVSAARGSISKSDHRYLAGKLAVAVECV